MKINKHTIAAMNGTSLKAKYPAPFTTTDEMPLDMKLLIAAVVQAGFPTPTEEFEFHASRKWRFDLCWEPFGVAFEREGGVYVTVNCKKCNHPTTHFRSRHHDQKGMEADVEKYNAAQSAGWCVIRATTPMMRDGRAVDAILEALKAARESSC